MITPLGLGRSEWKKETSKGDSKGERRGKEREVNENLYLGIHTGKGANNIPLNNFLIKIANFLTEKQES